LVVDFISYEGIVLATEGPASGMRSEDIGVRQTGATPPGQSLQLGGSGCRRGNFAWLAPAPATPGAINVGQEFADCP
ncbi:MAG: hypothetical protein ACF8R7_14450, partial [Phycisphaerales bacterium JB039]